MDKIFYLSTVMKTIALLQAVLKSVSIMFPNPTPWRYNTLLVSIFHQTPCLFWMNFFGVKSKKACGMRFDCILKINIYFFNFSFFHFINLDDLTCVPDSLCT